VLALAHLNILLAVTVLVVAVALTSRRKRPPSFAPLRAFAAERGWTFKPSILAHRDTPFLRLGDDQEAGPVLVVQAAGLDAELYEHRRIRVHDGTRAVEGTYVVLRLTNGLHLAGVDEVRLMPRATASPAAAALNHRRVVSLESVELETQFLLEVGDGTSDLAARELFTPGLIAGLLDLAAADCYLGEYLDFHLGRLVLASGGTITPDDGPALEETLRRVEPVVAHFAHAAAKTPGLRP
jgi:hypothetical protein